MSAEALRAEFEAWAVTEGWRNFTRVNGAAFYAEATVQSAWLAWQAARPVRAPSSRDLIQASDDYVASLRARADGEMRGAPVWHGWAIADAYRAGTARGIKEGRRLERTDAIADERSAATEAMWKERQGDEYGSY